MIRITVDLFPHGFESKKKTLYVCDIANVKCAKAGKDGIAIRSNYVAKFYPKNHISNTYRAVEVKYFPRYTSYGAWRLLLECLKRFFDKTKPDEIDFELKPVRHNNNLKEPKDPPAFQKMNKKKVFKHHYPKFGGHARVIKNRA